MKFRYILFIIFISLFFFFISSVSAKGTIVAPYYDFDNPENTTGTSKFTHLPTNATLPEEKKDNYNLALEYLANKCSSYDSYIISNKGLTSYGYDKQIELFCFNQSNNQITPSVSVTKSYYDGNNYYVYLNFYANVYKSSSVNYYYARFYDNKRVSENPKLNNNTVSIQFVSGDLASLNFGEFPILKSNIDFSFNNNYPTSTDNKILLLSSFKLNGIIYNLGDFGYKSGSLYDSTKNPTITINYVSDDITSYKDNDYIIGVNLNVKSSTSDDSSYICMFSFDDRETWDKYSCSEDYSYKATENRVYYAQIVDRSSEQVVASSTYKITTIQSLPLSGDKVDINFQKITSDIDSTLYKQCTIAQGKINFRACETISISFSTFNNDKYVYQLSYDHENWSDVSSRIYNNFFLERVFGNNIIYVRVLNRFDNTLNNQATFKVTTIEDTSSLGQNVLFSSTYRNSSPDVDVMMLFINYDPLNYNYSYSFYTTKDSFTDITSSINCSNNLCTFNTTVYVLGTVYVRIEDKSGNLIYSATYSVDYYRWIKNNNSYDTKDFYTNFSNSIDYFVSPIKDIFNKITIFFDSLPVQLKYTFYVAFILMIMLFLIQFIL